MPENLSGPRNIIRLHAGRARVEPDDWHLLESAEWDGQPGAVLPLALALAQTACVRAAGRVGLWLGPADDPAEAVPLFDALSLIGVQFPKFTDGRGYSTAYLLRTRLGWRGELRALGDVLQDQLFALRRVGFDSFALRADRDPSAALAGFDAFTGSYQGSVDQPLPAFRRGTDQP